MSGTPTNCDVVLTSDHRIYVNGTLIGNVVQVDINRELNRSPEMTLTIVPTSLVFGDIPTETLDAANSDRAPNDKTVDISRAISRAQARANNSGGAISSKPLPLRKDKP